MSVTLSFGPHDTIDANLYNEWPKNIWWDDYVMSSGKGILSYDYQLRRSTLVFESEAHKTWFLLRWS